MAQKQRNVAFIDYTNSIFFCWSELTDEEIESVEGVIACISGAGDIEHEVTIDPRYNMEDIRAELEILADEKAGLTLETIFLAGQACRKSYLVEKIKCLLSEATLETLEAAYAKLTADRAQCWTEPPPLGSLCPCCDHGLVTDDGCSYCGAGRKE